MEKRDRMVHVVNMADHIFLHVFVSEGLIAAHMGLESKDKNRQGMVLQSMNRALWELVVQEIHSVDIEDSLDEILAVCL